MKKLYYEKVIDEILELIKTNILLYYRNSDYAFINLKRFCFDKEDENTEYKKLDYWQLVFFIDEVLADLTNFDYLFDFRELE